MKYKILKILDKNKDYCSGITDVIYQEDFDTVANELNTLFSLHVVGKPKGELLNVSFNVGDKVEFDGKKAVVLWTSVKYLDIEIVGTNKILQGVSTSLVLPR